MDSKTKYGLGAALLGAFALGGVTVVSLSTAQPANGGAAETSATDDRRVRVPAPIRISDREPVETSFTDLQENEIRALVREYLMSNPEVIIESVNEYSRLQQVRGQQRAVDVAKANLNRLLDPAHGYIVEADAAAKVAVIELFDYHCGFCKRAAPMVKSLIEDEKDITVVFREYPIFGEKSEYAAEMALAAREQGKFLDMHFDMMNSSGDLTSDRIRKIAKSNGVDFAKLETARNAPIVEESIVETLDIVREMGVDGTPAFVIASIDGDYVNVVQGFDTQALIRSIEDARAAN